MDITLKKSMKANIVAAIAAVLLVVSLAPLAGCDALSGGSGAGASNSSTADDSYIGTWRATSAEAFGIEVGIAEVISGGFEIEIKTAGAAELRPLGQSIPCVWKASGDKITLSGGSIADFISGGDSASIGATMESGKLVLDDYTGEGVRIVFEKRA